MSDPENQTQWNQDVETAQRENTTVSHLQEERSTRALAEKLQPAELAKAKAQKEDAEKALEEARRLEQQALWAVAQWKFKQAACSKAENTLKRGEHQLAELQKYLARLVEYLDAGQAWGNDHTLATNADGTPHGLAALFGRILGARAAIADFERWRALQKEIIAKGELELAEFEREKGLKF